MNDTLLILGNGFDLSFGLKTSYGDFMNSEIFKDFANTTYLGRYLDNVQNGSKNWVDIEQELSKYCLEINSGGLMDAMKKYGPSLLQKEYGLLKSSLKEYLHSEISRCQTINLKSPVEELISFVTYGDNNKIATFNYTPLVEYITENDFCGNDKLLHIHGSLNDNDIVFGVEDDVELPKKHAFLYKAYSNSKRTHRFARWLQNAPNIIFYGYSLGDTDRQYFAEFFKALCKFCKTNKKIVFYHYGEQAYFDLKWQLMSFTSHQLSAFEMYNEVHFIDCSKDCNFQV